MTNRRWIAVAAITLLVATFAVAATTTEDKKEPKMKQYYFVMLKKGPSRGHDEATAAKIQEGHMAHIRATAAAGKLAIAGPFGDDGDWRGILIYDVPTLEEAETLCKQDPAVKAGRLSCEIHPWWTQTGATLK